MKHRILLGAAGAAAVLLTGAVVAGPASAQHTCTSGTTTFSFGRDQATVAFATGDQGRSIPAQCMAIRPKLVDKDGSVFRGGWIVSQPPTVSTANGDGSGKKVVYEQRQWATLPPTHQMHREIWPSVGKWTNGL